MKPELFTAVYAVLAAFIVTVIICPIVIPVLHRMKFGQPIREEGPQSHKKKEGTPTMGGIMILIGFIVSALIFARGDSNAAAVILITVGYGIVGFIDDFLKVVKKQNEGLKPLQKIVFQLIVTVIFYVYIVRSGMGTDIYIPFTDGYYIDLGWFYAPFLFFVMVGTVNSVNLTDGLDGLASGVTVLVAVFFLFVAYASAMAGLVYVCGAVIGALMGFLVFNCHPAKVFMGDTGSLALGGFVASTAILTKMPVMLVIVGFIYVCESLSVIIQVTYFKATHGKRIFKMAPIHHHFELSGLEGIKVVQLFWIVTAVMCLIGFAACRNFI
ncbi:MAG: phospho-N-acetylmuramoyl-pentapeptide-transferase [Clostridia bacterium]|nr:phospho-N-acetylmuramoyl-pentapeptide-transferase [Clostridia bacterium]